MSSWILDMIHPSLYETFVQSNPMSVSDEKLSALINVKLGELLAISTIIMVYII